MFWLIFITKSYFHFSIAKGMWVLHGSYMEACIAAGALLPESAYEWGNPDNGFLGGMAAGSAEARIAVAAAKSRRSVGNGSPPVFNGMTVVVHTKADRTVAFQRLLELGGAHVLYDQKPPFSQLPGTTQCVLRFFLSSNFCLV